MSEAAAPKPTGRGQFPVPVSEGMSNKAHHSNGDADAAAKTLKNRMATAGNPSTPAKTLAALAKDRSKMVRRLVAENRATQTETLAVLAKDCDMWVRRIVAGNPSTPAETLAALAGLTGEDIGNARGPVARNPNTPAATLTLLAKDRSEFVRCAVAGNPSTPPDLLAELAKDKHLFVRWEAAKTYTINHGTSAEAAAEILRAVLAGPERVVAIKAAAGTGRSHLLRTLAAQPGFVLCAPTTVIARALAADGIKARTPNNLLSDSNSRAKLKALVVVESAVLSVLWRKGSNDEFRNASGNEIMRHLFELDRQLGIIAKNAGHAKLILFP